MALVFPMIPVIVISANDGFVISRFPPIACVGKDADSTFYSGVLPVVVLYGIGTNFLLLILWRIRRVSVHVFAHNYEEISKLSGNQSNVRMAATVSKQSGWASFDQTNFFKTTHVQVINRAARQ